MKTHLAFQVLASCVALSAAQYGLVGHPNGAVVPVDEPAVAAARADHFAAGGGRGALGYAGVGYAAAPAIAAPAIAAAPVQVHTQTSLYAPKIQHHVGLVMFEACCQVCRCG